MSNKLRTTVTICKYPCHICFESSITNCENCTVCIAWKKIDTKKVTKRNSSGCNYCGGGECDRMRSKNRGIHDSRADIYWWCCLDLPIELITKPLRGWLCTGCAARQLHRGVS